MTEEKYLSFSFAHFQFIDSFSFLPSSLDKLVKCLRDDKKFDVSKFHYTVQFIKEKYPHVTDEHLKLVVQKGVVPYEYMDSFERYDETCLPPMNCFDSKLNNEKCKKEKYEHALNVWNTFNIKTLHEFWDFYLMTDITLLADVFEETRNVFMRDYGVDVPRYITLPSMGNDAALKTFGKSIKAMTEAQQNMYYLIERNIKGGVSKIVKRHAIANNPYKKF